MRDLSEETKFHQTLDKGLRRLAELAVRNNGPYSDNTSAAALRWLG